jgi:superfamily I DNA and/or RNA helicase
MPSQSFEEKLKILLQYVYETNSISKRKVDEIKKIIPNDSNVFSNSFEWESQSNDDLGKLVSMTTNQIAKARDMIFDYAIIDEASKCSFADIVICLSKIEHLVLIGDYMQLDPVYDDYSQMKNELSKLKITAEEWDQLNKSGFSMLFDKIVQYNFECGITDYTSNRSVGVMKRQYRMNKGIYDLISGVYNIHQGFKLLDEKQLAANDLMCIDMNADEDETGSPEIISNQKEAEFIAEIVNMISKDGDKYKGIKTIGIITGYSGQERKIKKEIRKRRTSMNGMQIGTFDRFQGREYDLVLVSMVRTKKLGFLKDVRRMNVAFSRAKNHLIVIGNFTKLANMNMPDNREFTVNEIKEMHYVYKELIPKLKKYSRKYTSMDNELMEIANFLEENVYE